MSVFMSRFFIRWLGIELQVYILSVYCGHGKCCTPFCYDCIPFFFIFQNYFVLTVHMSCTIIQDVIFCVLYFYPLYSMYVFCLLNMYIVLCSCWVSCMSDDLAYLSFCSTTFPLMLSWHDVCCILLFVYCLELVFGGAMTAFFFGTVHITIYVSFWMQFCLRYIWIWHWVSTE